MDKATLTKKYLSEFAQLANKTFCETLTVKEAGGFIILEVPLDSGIVVYGVAAENDAQWGTRVGTRKISADQYESAMASAGAMLAPMSLLTICVSAFLRALAGHA